MVYYFWCSRFESVKSNTTIKLIFLSTKELIIKVCNGKTFIIFTWRLMLKLHQSIRLLCCMYDNIMLHSARKQFLLFHSLALFNTHLPTCCLPAGFLISFSFFFGSGKQAESCASWVLTKTTPGRYRQVLHGCPSLQHVPRDRPDPGRDSC